MRRLFRALVVTFLLTGSMVPGHARERGAEPSGGGNASIESDFNGDGFSDLAVGASGEDLGAVDDAGVVHILYGSASGVVAEGNQLWSQDSGGIGDVAEEDDDFGSTLAAGDFDNDGYSDLAVGAPGEDLGTSSLSAGYVHVIYGSATGLTGAGSRTFSQDTTIDGVPIKGSTETNDRFGTRLTTDNFGKGGADDLVVGIPNADVKDTADAGTVLVLYGSGGGITAAGQQLWHQNSKQGGVAIKGTAQENDSFGDGLASGNFGKRGKDDLVIGSTSDNISGEDNAGSVNVLYSTKTGLKTKGNQLWHQDSPGVKDAAEQENYFGVDAAGGDFGRTTHEDLAVGVLGEKVGGNEFAGAVNVLYGSSTGLTGQNSQFFHQDSSSPEGEIGEEAETGDNFGASVLASNFGSGPRADLAIGAADEGDVGAASYGVLHVLKGGANGLTVEDDRLINQGTSFVEDGAEAHDNFGSRLGGGDFDGDGIGDLAVGVYAEDIGDVENAGATQVFYGASGLGGSTDQFWHQDTPLVEGGVEEFDAFGVSVGER